MRNGVERTRLMNFLSARRDERDEAREECGVGSFILRIKKIRNKSFFLFSLVGSFGCLSDGRLLMKFLKVCS
jgi:hypothetical protein